jgi:predicted dehydrogenase
MCGSQFTTMSELARRTLLRTSAAAMSALSYSRVLGANDTVQLAVIGCGGRGTGVMRSFLSTKQVMVTGLCDVWGDRVASAQQYAPSASSFSDHRKLLDSPNIDAVLIATPDHWHAPIAIDAVKAGKDVYCEKPLTLKIEEGPTIIQAARKANRVFQVGMQQRSGAHYIKARDEYIKKGRLGKITLVRTWWHGSYNSFVRSVPPALQTKPANLDWDRFTQPVSKRAYSPHQYYTFRAFLDYGGGQITDLFCHWLDVAHMFMDEDGPVAASAVGGVFLMDKEGSGRTAPDTISVQLQYPGHWVTTFEGQLLPNVNDGGLEFCGSEGKLYITRAGFEFTPYDRSQPAGFGRGGGAGPRREVPVRPPVTNAQTESVRAEGDLTVAHIQNFLECMRTRKHPNADVVIGHRSAQACHLATMSYKEKRQIRFDPVREKILS